LVINNVNSNLGKRGRGISGLWCLIGDGDSLVPDISNVTRVSIVDTVGDNLGATIGKGNTVFSSSVVSVAVLVVSVLGSSVVLISLDSITELVSWGVNWLRLSVDRGRPVGWGRDNDWGRGWDNDGLLTDDSGNWSWGNEWSRGNNNWGSDEGEGSTDEGSRSDTDEGSGSNAENGGWAGDNNRAVGVGVSVTQRAISHDGGDKAGENDESLQIR
jgi:hypothetical protein